MEEQKPIIRLVGLGKQFKTVNGPVTALEDIDLEIYPGEVFGIIGLSGAGKSTLVRCINYLEVPTSGAVIFDGVNLAGKSALNSYGEGRSREGNRGLLRWLFGEAGKKDSSDIRQARRSMGMIFQQFNLLSQRNVLQNVCFPMELIGTGKKEARKRAQELLSMVGLEDRMRAYPAQLSGGQKQRVAIARAMATNPKVLLCDEATSALDPNTTKQILDLLKKINREMGVTVIVITHEMAVIEAICDRVAIIDQSHIAEVGGVSEIFSNPKTDIGRRLILGDAAKKVALGTERQIRIIFDGRESSEPVISNLVLACKVPVNIMHAETKDVGGKAMGHMLIQIPEDETEANRVMNYLKTMKVTFEEVR